MLEGYLNAYEGNIYSCRKPGNRTRQRLNQVQDAIRQANARSILLLLKWEYNSEVNEPIMLINIKHISCYDFYVRIQQTQI